MEHLIQSRKNIYISSDDDDYEFVCDKSLALNDDNIYTNRTHCKDLCESCIDDSSVHANHVQIIDRSDKSMIENPLVL